MRGVCLGVRAGLYNNRTREMMRCVVFVVYKAVYICIVGITEAHIRFKVNRLQLDAFYTALHTHMNRHPRKVHLTNCTRPNVAIQVAA